MNTPEQLDWIQQLVAEHAIKHGVCRTITQEILVERCGYYTEVAKQEVEKGGPDKGDADSSIFVPTATVFGAEGQEAPNVRVGFKDGEKRRMMWALSQTCKTVLAQAIIMRIVATSVDMWKIAPLMGLNPPDPRDRQKIKYFEERMWNWIEKNYGKARLSALPPELRIDVIMVGGMGPKLHDAGTVTEFHWENGKLIFGETRADAEVHMSMVPRWWQ